MGRPRTLAGMLAWLVYPEMRRPSPQVFRFSHAALEKGEYTTDYGDWTPLTLPKDLTVELRAPQRQARRFHDAFAPFIEARSDAARAVLLHWGVSVASGPMAVPEDWELVEYALARRAEYATGEDILKHDDPSRPRLRPKFQAFVIDVGCLLMTSIEPLAPKLNRRFQGDVPGKYSDTSLFSCFPVLPKGTRAIEPFSAAWNMGFVPEDKGDRKSFMSYLVSLIDAPKPTSVEDGIHAWLDEIVDDTGELPDQNEFAAMMVDEHLVFEEVPRSVLERMGIDPDKLKPG